MYRIILCAAAALLVATAIQPAAADDASVCGSGIGGEAIAACTRILALNPKSAEAYNNRGNAYDRKGDYDEAISDLNQAIQLDPKNTVVYNNRGYAYNGKGDYHQAISDLNQAIRLNPKYAYAGRGYAYCHKGDYDRAISNFDQAIRLNPIACQGLQQPRRSLRSQERSRLCDC
jgi:tetratricopeptide (TPR) repeat protein